MFEASKWKRLVIDEPQDTASRNTDMKASIAHLQDVTGFVSPSSFKAPCFGVTVCLHIATPPCKSSGVIPWCYSLKACCLPSAVHLSSGMQGLSCVGELAVFAGSCGWVSR